MVVEYYDYIFEALASYYKAINEGAVFCWGCSFVKHGLCAFLMGFLSFWFTVTP